MWGRRPRRSECRHRISHGRDVSHPHTSASPAANRSQAQLTDQLHDSSQLHPNREQHPHPGPHLHHLARWKKTPSILPSPSVPTSFHHRRHNLLTQRTDDRLQVQRQLSRAQEYAPPGLQLDAKGRGGEEVAEEVLHPDVESGYLGREVVGTDDVGEFVEAEDVG